MSGDLNLSCGMILPTHSYGPITTIMEFHRSFEHCLHEDSKLWGDCLFRILPCFTSLQFNTLPMFAPKNWWVGRWSCPFLGGFGPICKWIFVSFSESSFKKTPVLHIKLIDFVRFVIQSDHKFGGAKAARTTTSTDTRRAWGGGV